jgi:pimeloyl-ACP methyl ester carboxylesterase
LGSDFLYWTALQVARDQVFRHVLATPPELIHATRAQEQARVNAMAERVLPVSLRALGLRDDTRLGKGLRPVALQTIRVPTLAISARDDAFGTFAGAEYTASRIPDAKFIGYDSGGHLLVGRDEAVRAAIVDWLRSARSP